MKDMAEALAFAISRKVLVIDDSKTARRHAERVLEREGFEVLTAFDGFDALAKIADHHPEIIFVDANMPRLDGFQTCALIKSNPRFRSIPVVMLSNAQDLFDHARSRLMGSDLFLTKPVSREDLLDSIDCLLH